MLKYKSDKVVSESDVLLIIILWQAVVPESKLKNKFVFSVVITGGFAAYPFN